MWRVHELYRDCDVGPTVLRHLGLFDRLGALMKDWRKKFAALLLLLLPFQALGASLSAFTCYSGETSHSTASAPEHDHGSAPASHTHDGGTSHQHDGESGAGHSAHQNCHHVFSGMPAATVVNVPAELPEFASAISLLFTLFVPERPQRPPRL